MGKILAIKGDKERGNEVIALLEMMGGINDREYIGTNTWKDEYYFLDNGYIRAYDWCDGIKFTLEEFLEKYPFKIGDKVMDDYVFGDSLTIKSMRWSEELKTVLYSFEESDVVLAAKDLKVANDDNTKPTKETIIPAPDITANMTDKNNCDIQCPDGYEFYDENGNLIGNKVMMRPKKPKYPNDYKTCCDVLYANSNHNECYEACLRGYPMDTFARLLICRDTYWKIAGVEMGLDKPWKPNYDSGVNKYGIICMNGVVQESNPTTNWERHLNKVLDFPTEEMRDAFYENFKYLIEECKELL